MAFLMRCYANCLRPWSSKLPTDLQKMHLREGPGTSGLQASRHSHCSMASDSGSSSLSDIYQATESDAGAGDMSVLPEGIVDSDDDDDEDEEEERRIDSIFVRDTIRESLDKEPEKRTDEDIENILDFLCQLPAFTNVSMTVRRELCAVMKLVVIEHANSLVLRHAQELDSWFVILNGSVEIIRPDGHHETLCMGNAFGVTLCAETQTMFGDMHTKVDDCEFMCVTQQDFCRIVSQVERNTRREEEAGEVVLVTEHRPLDCTGSPQGCVVIQGTPERLVSHLLEEQTAADPTYVEDFLLTFRTFFSHPSDISTRLLTWFQDDKLKDKVTRVVLLWVNNHFNDFEGDPAMSQFLEDFKASLERKGKSMHGHLRLLNIACAAKAKQRTLVLTRPSREAPLGLSLIGGSERHFGIFVESVEVGSRVAQIGLHRGDQILEVNGQNFETILLSKAMDILQHHTHLSLIVRTNMMVFHELLCRMSDDSVGTDVPHFHDGAGSICQNKPNDGGNFRERTYGRAHIFDESHNHLIPSDLLIVAERMKGKGKASTVSGRSRLRRLVHKTFGILPTKSYSGAVATRPGQSQDDSVVGLRASGGGVPSWMLRASLSLSNPDLLQCHRLMDFNIPTVDLHDQVIRVFRADQSSRYLLVGRETTASQAVALALHFFQLLGPPEAYALCEVSVTPECVIKQRRLPEQLSNLAERIPLNARYYLKGALCPSALCPDEAAAELLRESYTGLLQLSSSELAAQLSLRLFQLFRAVEPTEYLNDLFHLGAPSDPTALHRFEEALNQETFWVATEVLGEPSQMKRVKVIKHFIKIACHCRACNNFNSMFAIISGLSHVSVTRLAGTWEKLPAKYGRLYRDLQDLFDPSRNMTKYRQVLAACSLHPPVIPLLPVIKKDLTFLHEGNDTKVDGLVNFEKLRMIAKEIRHVCQMAAFGMDPAMMFRQRSVSQVSGGAVALEALQNVTHRKRTRRSTLLNPRKLYEDAQMGRRVRQYLMQLQVNTDEEQLMQKSLQLELSTSSTPSVAVSRSNDRRAGHLVECSSVVMRCPVAYNLGDPNIITTMASPLPQMARVMVPSLLAGQIKRKGSQQVVVKSMISPCSENSNRNNNSDCTQNMGGVPLTRAMSKDVGMDKESEVIGATNSGSGSCSAIRTSRPSMNDENLPKRDLIEELEATLAGLYSRRLARERACPGSFCMDDSGRMGNLSGLPSRHSLVTSDSGRDSWTSCSSGSHDSIAAALASGHCKSDNNYGGTESWMGDSDSQCSWTSSTGSSPTEENEADTGTIKRRNGKDCLPSVEASTAQPTSASKDSKKEPECCPLVSPEHHLESEKTTLCTGDGS
uniref:Rap guanine nucleotide exchange factor (GEF) 6 n=1 Tax=Eptatretus burgeri TaxID=7764 RepID=A0A8C4RB92_EPTBU